MRRTDEAFVDDILAAATSIGDYVGVITRDDFLSNNDATVRAIRDGIIRQVGIIGEAASKLSTSFRRSRTDISWPQIIGMRNIVVHQYWNVDLDVVWDAATKDVPELVRQLRPPPPLAERRRLRRRY